MSEARHALERLCAHFGIVPEYVDIVGERHRIADENLVALLAEFGVDASTLEEIPGAEREAQAASWREAMPPVTPVIADVASWSVVLRLPEGATRMRWNLVEENGARHHGEFDASTLDIVARATIDGQRLAARTLTIALALPPGYHRFALHDLPGEMLLIAAPPRCYEPPALHGDGRVWGVAAQLYSLRSARNWGMGDFGDLKRFVEHWADCGADIIGVNPLHALFAHNPAHVSPYSPSSRRQLNVLYIDVEAVADYRDCELARRHVVSPAFQARLAALRESSLVDYPGVAGAKLEVLAMLYSHFREHHLAAGSARAGQFREFQVQGGKALRQHALFEALQGHFHAGDASVWGWPVWPQEYRDPASDAVRRFEERNAERIEWHEYLQWQASRQLMQASRRCHALRLGVGLYLDLAISVDRAGSDVWTHQECYASAASIGAPPDEFNPSGQGWGLPPLRPDRLRASRYRVLVETLRENMLSAGALRIDHVMGLMRLFWIPPGCTARDGAYVRYGLEEMLAIVALESHRNRCMVIGEDLGTVPDEIRTALAQRGILSCRLLYFQRYDDGDFKPASEYPRDALVAVGTHDLPTLAGWWQGRDLRVRRELGLTVDDGSLEQQLSERARDRGQLLRALARDNRLPSQASAEDAAPEALDVSLVRAIHACIADTPSRVMLLQVEDALGIAEQANLPGTMDEHPNWRRKLPVALERFPASTALGELARTLSRLRPSPIPHSLNPPRSLHARVPRATYRLQFHRAFTFDDAVRIIPYLSRLGISHVYCSPILRARPGSTHGYDIVAHDEISPELGGATGFERFSAALREHGMGQLLDMVPNHMGVLGADNAWWMDVLENGPSSAHARHFDIEWEPVDPELRGKVLLPVLGGHYGDVLVGEDLHLAFEPAAGSFALRYHEHRFPLDPRTYAPVLASARELCSDAFVGDELAGLAVSFAALAPRDTRNAEAIAERARSKERHKASLARLTAERGAAGRAIDAALAGFNAEGARDALHELIEAQAYRLAYWRVASDEINYRRFFDINDLAALRMEDAEVFEATHRFVLDLAATGAVDGLRIDHPDGLHDPAGYFRSLQEGYVRRAGFEMPGRDGHGRPARPLYVVAEKITAPHEDMPYDWPVHGTTGYRFANVVNGVLIDSAAGKRFDRVWRVFSGVAEEFTEIAYRGKRAIMRSTLAAELTVLATELLRIARADRRTRDYTFNTLRGALAEVAACMPVYRTYIVDVPSAQDLRYVDWAVAQARRRSQADDTSIFDFVRQSLLAEAAADAPAGLQARVLRFAMRFQQFSAPVAAKGVEDTAFYRYSRLVSLNEVGGDPGLFGITVRAFHGASADRAAHWPHTIVATSTHDNKRSEDVRSRIDVLSELPAAWRLALRRWRLMNRSHRIEHDSGSGPSPADEYLLYQILLGTVPAAGIDETALEAWRERIETYMLKAAREAKTHTSWISPNEAYEEALTAFVRGALARLHPNPFLDDLRALAESLAWFGAMNSLSMTLIKLTSPGVPDLYQGNELMDLSLVDPDNRRPVDYIVRERWLDEMVAMHREPGLPARLTVLAAAPHDGRAKLWLTWRLLQLHRENPQLFASGGYTPLTVKGARAGHVLGYARQHGNVVLVALAGRLFAQLLGEPGALPLGEGVWSDTTARPSLPDGTRLENVLTGEILHVEEGAIRLADAFASFPGAVFLAKAPLPGA